MSTSTTNGLGAGQLLAIGALLLVGVIGALALMPGSHPLTSSPSTNQELSIVGQPTVSAAFIEQTLKEHNSPAQGTGQALYDLGVQAGINPAFALAFFRFESGFGTAGWAKVNLSLGNIRCEQMYPCNGGYAQYPSWQEGYHDWYRLIKAYVADGLTTIPAIIHRYAPQADNNDEATYAQTVTADVQAWSHQFLSRKKEAHS